MTFGPWTESSPSWPGPTSAPEGLTILVSTNSGGGPASLSGNLRMVPAAVALDVALAAQQEGLAEAIIDQPIQQVHQAIWRPEYPRFELA
jgi:hypothetical protein